MVKSYNLPNKEHKTQFPQRLLSHKTQHTAAYPVGLCFHQSKQQKHLAILIVLITALFFLIISSFFKINSELKFT